MMMRSVSLSSRANSASDCGGLREAHHLIMNFMAQIGVSMLCNKRLSWRTTKNMHKQDHADESLRKCKTMACVGLFWDSSTCHHKDGSLRRSARWQLAVVS